MKDARDVYRERTWAPTWVWALLSVVGLASVGGVLLGGEEAASPWLVVVGALLVGLVSCFSRLDVEVLRRSLRVGFGPVRVARKHIAYGDIESARPVKYRPVRDFGGWGIRWRGGKTAWTIRGNRAVRVRLRSGKRIFVGSEHSQRLAYRVQAAAELERRAQRRRKAR
ncbi:MAG: DUF3093 family protein [Gemmatimonadetes bacterium]|nr:DUF3093 family protein [Gemmatimonadota bacterium]